MRCLMSPSFRREPGETAIPSLPAGDGSLASRRWAAISNKRFAMPMLPWIKFILQARTIVKTSAQRVLPDRPLPENFPWAEILHLFQAIAHGQPVREFDEAYAVENKGFKNCIHGRRGSSR